MSYSTIFHQSIPGPQLAVFKPVCLNRILIRYCVDLVYFLGGEVDSTSCVLTVTCRASDVLCFSNVNVLWFLGAGFLLLFLVDQVCKEIRRLLNRRSRPGSLLKNCLI